MAGIKLVVAFVTAALLATAVGIALSGGVAAADLLDDLDLLDAPEITTQSTRGWYLRGDLSYDFNTVGKPKYHAHWLGSRQVSRGNLDDGYGLGFGIGYQFSEDFRVDLTGAYLSPSEFTGTLTGPCDGASKVLSPNCTSTVSSEFTAYRLLANAYADLGNFNGITPYVGAGLGAAHVSWGDVSGLSTCVAPPCGSLLQNKSGGTGMAGSGDSSWRFAWALHAGISYDIAEHTKIDLAYSYNRIAGGGMFADKSTGQSIARDRGIDSHVIRIGLRYQIG